MTTPPLAMPALTMAICSGVTRTSYWPIADWAVCGALMSVGNRLGSTRIGIRSVVAEAELGGLVASACAPSLHAEGAEGGVARDLERVVQRGLVVRAAGLPVVVGQAGVVCGRSMTAGAGDLGRVGVDLPFSRAAAAVTILNVEPGG